MSEKKVIMDGNTAAGYIGYLMSELSIIYPITPSSPMSELNDEMASNDKLNLFGQTVKVIEMQSEAGAAGALHGSLAAGALTTTYTSSQGLLLMIPNMYKIAGECLPTVFHVAARTVASHALSIFGDHSDVMACRQTGFCMLAANNPQEALDLGFISHVATYKVSLPFLHFFDGFRTSHQINDIQAIDQKVMLDMLPLNEINRFRRQAHNPNHPHQSGTAQNPDIFFQNREASNILYNNAYDKVVNVMKEFGEKTGRKYQPFMYSGAHDATNVVIAMGSGADTISEACEYLIKNKKRAGLLKVHLYRPFNAKAFIAALPKTVRKIAVLDRTKEPGAVGEPLYLDVVTAIRELGNKSIKIYGGRYGLASKDFTVNDAVAVYRNLTNLNPKQHFTVGIDDDLTHHSLKSTIDKKIKSDAYEMKFFGLGSDGTVSANKSSIKIVGALTDLSVQGYFEYDSKKSGSLTISHLRTANHPIYNPYLVKQADFIAIHNYAFVHQYDVLDGLKTNGKVLLNTSLTDEQLGRDLPKEFKKRLKRAKAKLYVCPAFDVAKAAGLKNRINVVMQACFFKIADIIPYEQAAKSMKDFASKAYASKGEEILNANMKAIDNAIHDLREIDINQLVKITTKTFTVNHEGTKYYNNFVHKINHRLGDTMKVSEFDPSGSVPNGTTQYEKRGIAQAIPIWSAAKCIECGQCVLVCPHAAMRSYLVSDQDKVNAPKSLALKQTNLAKNASFAVQVSPLDCTGCEVCVNSCLARDKALVMQPLFDAQQTQETNYRFLHNIQQVPTDFAKNTIRGIQFSKPYFEFSGACAGCGESPYIKLVTQLFGNSMLIANATGCSSIYGGSAPSNPYTIDDKGYGPSWANSLFEDNAEFGFGMEAGSKYQRDVAFKNLEVLLASANETIKPIIQKLLSVKDTYESKKVTEELIAVLKSQPQSKEIANVLASADHLPKKSTWIIGGDGWGYDIGYGGLDHVIANKENVNILVLDTEVYSNTGGQASKATPAGSIAKFAATGKLTRKKDLGLIAMSYKEVYVAQVSMGANPNQLLKAIIEAESYNGPSLIIAYAPCINHGFNLANAQQEMRKAVETGYWTLYRYDPRNKLAPLTIDSPEPTKDYKDFLMGESRYTTLMKKHPQRAQELFVAAAQEAHERRETLKRIVNEQTKN